MKGLKKVPLRKSKKRGFGDFGKIGSTIGSQMGSLLGKRLGSIWGRKMAKKYLPSLTLKLAGTLFPDLPVEILPVILPLINNNSPFFNNNKKYKKNKKNNTKKNDNKKKNSRFPLLKPSRKPR